MTKDTQDIMVALKRVSQGVHELHEKGIDCQEAKDYALLLSALTTPSPTTSAAMIDLVKDLEKIRDYPTQEDLRERIMTAPVEDQYDINRRMKNIAKEALSKLHLTKGTCHMPQIIYTPKAYQAALDYIQSNTLHASACDECAKHREIIIYALRDKATTL